MSGREECCDRVPPEGANGAFPLQMLSEFANAIWLVRGRPAQRQSMIAADWNVWGRICAVRALRALLLRRVFPKWPRLSPLLKQPLRRENPFGFCTVAWSGYVATCPRRAPWQVLPLC